MTSSPVIPSLPRRAGRWLAWLASVGAVLGVCLVASFYFWFLPNIADYRDTVAALLSRAMGQRVTLEAVSAEWQQARPEITLRGMRVHDRQNRPALFLERLDARFAWRSLLFLEPRFTHLELAGPALTIRRARDGHFYAGGLILNADDSGSAFSDWLLKQGKIHISGATLAWQDEMRGAPTLVLRRLEATLQNRFHRHQLQLHATPPPYLARPFTLKADLRGRSLADSKTWSGLIHGDVAGLDLPQFSRWIDLPYEVTRGVGAANLTLKLDRGSVNGMSVALNVRDVASRLDTTLPPLRLARLRGRMDWQQQEKKHRIEFRNINASLAGGTVIPAFDATLEWGGERRELGARNLNLASLRPVLPALPVPPTVRARIDQWQPRARIDELRLRWQGEQPGDAGFDVIARFTGLHLAALGARPGVSNLSGNVRGNEKSGVIELQGRAVQLDLPSVFRDPKLPLDTLHVRGSWKKRENGTRFSFAQIDFANADAAGSAHGSYESVRDHPGMIDMNAHLTRGDATAIHRYLPKKIGDQTRNWVRHAIVAGRSRDTRLTLKGDLARFPFPDDQGGVFKVTIQAEDVILDYVPGWPRIEGIQGVVVFHGKGMQVTSDQGRIFNTRLGRVKAVIADLSIPEGTLDLSGQASGPAQDFIRYANFSPVGARLDGLTDQMQGKGNAALALNLKIPLHHSRDTTLGGRLSFLGASLTPAGLPRLDQTRGDIIFTQDTVRSEDLNAQFLGGPIALKLATRDGHAVIQAAGRATSTGLASWLGKNLSARLSGETGWRGRVELAGANTQVHIESDLVGMESRLPAPLNKSAAQALPLTVTRFPQPDSQQLFEAQLGKTLGAIWLTTAANRIERGELRFGGAARLPQEPGWRLIGNGRGLDISDWISVLPDSGDDTGFALTSIDLGLNALDLMGRRFTDVRIQGQTRGGLLRMAVSGRDMNGTLTYRAATATGASSARVSAQFKQLTIPAAQPGDAKVEHANFKAIDVPMLDLNVEDFRLGARALGRLEAVAHGSPQGLVIDSLKLTHADSVMRMNGLWRDTGKGETQANVQLNVVDAGRMLSRFGYGDAIKRGRATISGDVTWEGTPADFGFATLGGMFNFKAENGQFLKIEPGAAKLLGVLSLQSLPRRLSFDFRDIFNDGFAFDEISATMRIARGVVYSDDLRMKGPAAKVAMSGLARLTDETVQLRVRVNPKLSEGVAVAGALIGGPIAGLGMLAAQKLLRDPFEEATGKEYMVTGPWREPQVTRLVKFKNQNALKDSDG